MNEAVRAKVEAGFMQIITHTAQAHGATATIGYHREYPVLINDAKAVRRAETAIHNVLGPSRLAVNFPPLMAAEDFAFMLKERPGAYILLGQGKDADNAMVHHPLYDFNDDILAIGASVLVRLMEE